MEPTTNPVQADALGQPLAFEFDGDTFTVSPPAEWDVDVLEAFEEGQVVRTVKGLLGAEQWAKFKAPGRTVTELGELFTAIQGAAGIPS